MPPSRPGARPSTPDWICYTGPVRRPGSRCLVGRGPAAEPRLAALAYFSLGADVEEESRAYLRDYYAFLGPYADAIAESALRTPDAIKAVIAAYSDLGFTELYLDPTSSRVDQVDRLAEVVL